MKTAWHPLGSYEYEVDERNQLTGWARSINNMLAIAIWPIFRNGETRFLTDKDDSSDESFPRELFAGCF